MALFGSKKKSEEKVDAKKAPAKTTAKKARAPKAVAVAAPKAPKVASGYEHGDHALVLLRPRITEKASLKAESESVFVFEVARNANKEMIHRAIVDLYKVTPRKIGIAQTPSKNVFSRGKNGVQKGVKKAYVYLKKGEKIELI
jgi:large subunit ribosomal protein L23